MRTIVVVAAFLMMAAPAQAEAADLYHWSDQDGNPIVKVRPSDRSMTSATWSSCKDGGTVCVPIASTVALGASEATPGPTAPGTVFEAVVTYPDQSEERFRTPPWQGGFAVATPPTILAAPVTGSPISVDWGTTQGGWPGTARHEYERVLACEQPNAGECYVIRYGAMDAEALDARWVGWYLTADVLWNSGPDDLTRVQGWLSPPYRLNLTATPRFGARSAAVGPIASAATPAPVPAAASASTSKTTAPRVSLRARAVREHGRLTLGRVTCAQRCAMRLKVSGGGRRAYQRSFAVEGTQRLTMPPRRGALSVRVVIDGTLVTTGRTRYGAKS